MSAAATPTDWADYDWAVLRVVPHVHVEMFVNVGVVLHARTRGYLGLRVARDLDRLGRWAPGLDLDRLGRYLEAYHAVAEGGAGAGPIGLLPPSERFHWLTAPRSAVLQSSDVHAGRTRDPAATLDRLFACHVAPFDAPVAS